MTATDVLLFHFDQPPIVGSAVGESEFSSFANACGISRSDIDCVTVAKQYIAVVLRRILPIDASIFEGERDVVINCPMKCRVKNPCIDDELDATEPIRGRQISESADSGCVSLDVSKESICIAEDESDGQFVRVKLPMKKQQQLRESSNRCCGRVCSVRNDPRCMRKKKTLEPYWCFQHVSQKHKYESWQNSTQDRDEIERSYPWFPEVSTDINKLCAILACASVSKRSTRKVQRASPSNSAHLSEYGAGGNGLKTQMEVEFGKFGFTSETATSIAAYAIESGVPQHLTCAEWATRWVDRGWPEHIAQVDVQVDENGNMLELSIKDVLRCFGFTPAAVDLYTERMFASGASYHLGVDEWVTRFIEIDSAGPSCIPVPQCPLDGGASVSTGGPSTSTDAQSASAATAGAAKSVQHVNFMLDSAEPWSKAKKLLNDLDDKNGYKPYFHATTPQWADSLERHGIGTPRGKQGKDFSDGDGFYVHATWLAAVQWAGKSGRVLVYLTPPNYLEDACGKNYLDLREDASLWAKVIRYYRTGKADGGRFDELAKVAAIVQGKGFIRGLIADSTAEAQRVSWRFAEIKSLLGQDVQVCIKTTALAAALHQTLVAVFHIK